MSWGEGEPEYERTREFPCELCGDDTDHKRRLKGSTDPHPLRLCHGCDKIFNEKEIIEEIKKII